MGVSGQFEHLHGAEQVPDKAGKFERRNCGCAEVQDHFSDTLRAMIGPRIIGDGLVDQSTQTTSPMKTGI